MISIRTWWFIFLLVAFRPFPVGASHNRGAEITYAWLQGNEYEIKITTYIDASSTQADRPFLDSVHLGDGSQATFYRIGGPLNLPGNIKQNTYVKNHVYLGSGSYLIYFCDPNWSYGMLNIPNSFYVPFCVSSLLNISAVICPNNSVTFAAPILTVPRNKSYRYNLAASDENHDSLSFELVPCEGVAGYTFPPGFTIDPIAGEIFAAAPLDTVGAYGFAVKVSEWRQGIKIGYVIREFALEITPDADTSYYFLPPPFPPDTSGNFTVTVNAGAFIAFDITYIDGDSTPSMNVYSEAMLLQTAPLITYDTTVSNQVTAFISWTPDSLAPRNHPYIFTFRGLFHERQTDLTVLIYITGRLMDTCYVVPHIGVDEIEFSKKNLFVYPNPVNSELMIRGKGYEPGNRKIEIYSVHGQKVYESIPEPVNTDPGYPEYKLDVSRLQNGVYQLVTNYGNGTFCVIH